MVKMSRLQGGGDSERTQTTGARRSAVVASRGSFGCAGALSRRRAAGGAVRRAPAAPLGRVCVGKEARGSQGGTAAAAAASVGRSGRGSFHSQSALGSLPGVVLAEAAGAGDRPCATADRLFFSQVHALREKRGSAEPVPPSALQGFNIQPINRIMAFYPPPPAVLLMNYYVLRREQMLDNLRKL